MRHANTISGHLKDLGKRDINVAYDCVQWLQPNQRDIDRRARPKRIANRYIAACMIVNAAENPAFARELLDRTEGKVAQEVITLDGNKLIEQLEAGRQRVLAQYSGSTVEGQVVTRQLDTDNALDQQSSARRARDLAIPPQGEAQGPIGGVESHGISPLEREPKD